MEQTLTYMQHLEKVTGKKNELVTAVLQDVSLQDHYIDFLTSIPN